MLLGELNCFVWRKCQLPKPFLDAREEEGGLGKREPEDLYTASILSGLSTAYATVGLSLLVPLLGRGPHKNCKNDLDDQT